MASAITQFNNFLNEHLQSQRYLAKASIEGEVAWDSEHAVLSHVKVDDPDRVFEADFIAGPAFHGAEQDLQAWAEEAVELAKAKLGCRAGKRVVAKVRAPDEDEKIKQRIEKMAKGFLKQHAYFVKEVGRSDPEKDAVFLFAQVEIRSGKRLKIIWLGGPGRKLLEPGMAVEDLTGDFTERILKALPQLKDYIISQSLDD